MELLGGMPGVDETLPIAGVALAVSVAPTGVATSDTLVAGVIATAVADSGVPEGGGANTSGVAGAARTGDARMDASMEATPALEGAGTTGEARPVVLAGFAA